MRTGRAGYICVRSIFGILNGLIWVLGCGVVGLAVWLRAAYGGYVSLLPQHGILSLDAVILFGGVVLFATAFLGCCGAWCKNRCLLISYFILVTFLSLVELTGGILGFVYHEAVTSTLQQELQTGIRDHYNSTQEVGITLAWDTVQVQLNCCGVVNYEDWFNISAWPGNSYVPHSCCLPSFKHMPDCGYTGQISMWFPSGCYDQVKKWFEERLHLIGVVGIAVAIIQLFGLISSMILFCAARERAGFKTYKVRSEKSAALL